LGIERVSPRRSSELCDSSQIPLLFLKLQLYSTNGSARNITAFVSKHSPCMVQAMVNSELSASVREGEMQGGDPAVMGD